MCVWMYMQCILGGFSVHYQFVLDALDRLSLSTVLYCWLVLFLSLTLSFLVCVCVRVCVCVCVCVFMFVYVCVFASVIE